MIDHEHRCIFVHIPKTAGESVETAFLGGPLNRPGDAFTGLPGKHWSIARIREHEPQAFRDYYKFGIVRNPWDRYVSSVLYRRRQYDITAPLPVQFREELTLPFFHSRSASEMLFIDGELAVDQVVRFEDLEAGMSEVWQALGMPPVDFPRTNVNAGRQPYASYYDRYAMSFIRHTQRNDIERFGYDFEGDVAGQRLAEWRGRGAAAKYAGGLKLRPLRARLRLRSRLRLTGTTDRSD